MQTEDHTRMPIRELQSKQTWAEHPRVTLGLSPATLDLGLSPEDLYDQCRRCAREVLRRVHPDALTLLNHRELWDLAILSFREGQTSYRTEIQTLWIRISSLEKEFKDLTAISESVQKPMKRHGV